MDNSNNNENNVENKTSTFSYKKSNKNFKVQNSFTKNVLIPFFSGILGSVIFIGACFGIPSIRDNIFKNINSSFVQNVDDENKNNTSNLVSLSSFSDTAVGVAETVRPSIVGINVEYTINSMFNRSSTAQAEGSGIIINKDGYILTNNHIVNTSSNYSYQVSEANKITVYLYNDPNEYEAKIVGTDSQTDLAVIKIEKTDLMPATLGNSDDVRVGEFSMTIGNPLGMQSSVTSGIISATDREVTDIDGIHYKLIQTDAAINSGNSGGALVNNKCEVIGINTLKLAGTGIEGMGFAIPINSTKDIYDQLIQYNKVKRPYIGITGIDITDNTAKLNNTVKGIYIKDIDSTSAAEKAGLKIGDIIISANDKNISTMNELNEFKNSLKINDKMNLKINRDGKEIDIDVTLQEQP